MKKRKSKKQKSDREVLRDIFPEEIVLEVDETIKELDAEPRRENPGNKKVKPWGKKWAEQRKRMLE
jgi:hypothetical protein